MKKLVPLLFLLALTAAVSANTNKPNRAKPSAPYNTPAKMNTGNPLGGPPPIPSSIDGLGPPPAIPIALDPFSGSLLLGLVGFGAKKVFKL